MVDPDRSPIFLIGTGRSGTTLLRQILNAHPRIYLTNEAFFYSYERFTPKSLSASQWLERYFDTFSFAWLRISPDEVRDALPGDLPRARISEAFQAIMKITAAHQGKARYGEKSPLNTSNLKRIFHDFPDARVIYIMRDPRATAVSYTRMPWGSSSFSLSSLGCRYQFKETKPYLHRIHEMTLENLLESPRKVLGELLAFLGEDWDDAVLNHREHSPVDDVAPFPWFVGATRKKLEARKGPPLWSSVLSPAWIRIIERENAPGMQHFGYAPAGLEREPTMADIVKARIWDAPEAVSTLLRITRALPKLWNFRFSDAHRIDPQLSMEAHLTFNPRA